MTEIVISINPLFDAPPITEVGVSKIKQGRVRFSDFLADIESLVGNTNSREFSIVKTKLEEAWMMTGKAIAHNNLKMESL